MKHLTIINRFAGGFTEREAGKILTILTSSKGLEGEVMMTPNLATLAPSLTRRKDLKPDILGVGGGDGTARILSLVEKIWGDLPEYIAPFAMGTMNNYAQVFNLTDGFKDKIKHHTGFGDTKPVQLAQYIRDTLNQGEKLKTGTLDMYKVNGRSAFNVGFGVTPKLIWLYYGKTIDQFRRLQENLKLYQSEDYEDVVKSALSEKTTLEGLVNILPMNQIFPRVPVLNVAKAFKTSVSGVLGLTEKESEYVSERMQGKITVYKDKESEPFIFPQDKKPIGIYIAAYEHSNLGFASLSPKPLPEARQIPGKMQIMTAMGSPQDILREVYKIWFGRHMNCADYRHAHGIEIESDTPFAYQVDGDIQFSKKVLVEYHRPVKIISLEED